MLRQIRPAGNEADRPEDCENRRERRQQKQRLGALFLFLRGRVKVAKARSLSISHPVPSHDEQVWL